MVIKGVDYSRARPDPACLYKDGQKFAIRYTSIGANTKNISPSESKKLTAAGLRIVIVFEETAGHMRLGAQAGLAAAKASLAMAKLSGAPSWAPHYFALDEDTTNYTASDWLKCAQYLDATASIVGEPQNGLYGDKRAMVKLASKVDWRWQTYAWSRKENSTETEWIPGIEIQQFKNNVTLCGGAVDLNRALVPSYGQWGYHVYTAADLRRAQVFARGEDSDLYKWAGDGPAGWDCSGFMSGIIASLMGDLTPWDRRMFATGNIATLVERGSLPMIWPGMGDSGDFNMGVVYPWEMNSGIGHIAGTLGGLNVESRGGDGVVIGSAARGATNPLFRHHFHVKIDAPTLTTPTPTYPPFPGRILKIGVRGADVRKYQSQMHHRGWAIGIDGDYGPKTAEMTKAFQRDKKLTVDGEVGPNTWKCVFTCPIT